MQGTWPLPLVDLLARLSISPGRKYRGLAVLDLDQTTDEELDHLHAIGVRGIRLHKVSWGFGHQETDELVAKNIQTAASRLNRLGWVLDLYMHPKAWAAVAPIIDMLPESTKIVADHWAGFKPGDENSAEFEVFLGLVRRRRLYVKLSAFERQYHGNEVGMRALEPMARAFIEAGGDRLLFASDWPNTALASSREGKTKEQRLCDVEEYRQVDHAAHIRELRQWIKDDDIWRKLWVDTPEKLFG